MPRRSPFLVFKHSPSSIPLSWPNSSGGFMWRRASLFVRWLQETDTIFTSLSNSWANVVPGEGHTIIKQGNPAVILKPSSTGVKAVTHDPVVRSSGVLKDDLWQHWRDRVHLNIVTAEVFWSEKVSSWLGRYLVDPVPLSDTPSFPGFTLKCLSPKVTQEQWTDHGSFTHRGFGFWKQSTRSSLPSTLFFDWLNDALNGGLW